MTVPATKWSDQELINQVQTIEDKLNALITAFNAHTHRGDGAQVGQYNTSKPQSDTQTVTPVTASSVTSLDLSV